MINRFTLAKADSSSSGELTVCSARMSAAGHRVVRPGLRDFLLGQHRVESFLVGRERLLAGRQNSPVPVEEGFSRLEPLEADSQVVLHFVGAVSVAGIR